MIRTADRHDGSTMHRRTRPERHRTRTRAIRYPLAAYRRKKTGPKAGFFNPHAVSGARAPRDI
ncbi:hypothetical protein [Burkholderia ambifaria]|uniref:hypothetical protein n=1 Tax=Burkholderia ambifaria TaxID=152480 RepID=UPI00158B40AC|nr:hypothetical protein [Burkholderia ambifaria]